MANDNVETAAEAFEKWLREPKGIEQSRPAYWMAGYEAGRAEATRVERARIRAISEDMIRHLAQLVRLPTVPVKRRDDELLHREAVITIAMRLKDCVDKLIASESDDGAVEGAK